MAEPGPSEYTTFQSGTRFVVSNYQLQDQLKERYTKLLIAGLLAVSTVAIAVPASAQGIYVGPRGGVGVGADPYYGGGYDRNGYGRDGYAEPYYEGRSIYRDRDGYDNNNDDVEDEF